MPNAIITEFRALLVVAVSCVAFLATLLFLTARDRQAERYAMVDIARASICADVQPNASEGKH